MFKHEAGFYCLPLYFYIFIKTSEKAVYQNFFSRCGDSIPSGSIVAELR
jgi:hypothetical protein